MTPQTDGFAGRLEPKGRILDLSEQGYVVWDCAPIYGPDGKVHVFFTRVPGPQEEWFKNFRVKAGIVHATAPRPEGPYEVHEVVLKGRPNGSWDAYGIVNPRIHRVGHQFALFYTAYEVPWPLDQMKEHIGLLLSDDLVTWTPANNGAPLLSPNVTTPNAWDSMVVNNAAFVENARPGKYCLYYRGTRTLDRFNIGLAVADSLCGPYTRVGSHPLIDTATLKPEHGGEFRGFEDPCVWQQDGLLRMLVKDTGYFADRGGCYLESEDGIHWSPPQRGYYSPQHYWNETGDLDTPLILFNTLRQPEYLFVNRYTGGRASGFVFKIR
jgi:hypothetical protein